MIKQKKYFILIITLFSFFITPLYSSDNPVIAVVFDAKYKVFTDIFRTFRTALLSNYVRVIKTSFFTTDSDEEIINRINNVKPTHIFAIGSKAAKISAKTEIPGLFTMVSYPEKNSLVDENNIPLTSLTGIRIEQETLEKYQILKSIAGPKNKLGIIYSNESEDVTNKAETLAVEAGFEVFKYKVSSSSEVRKNFTDLQNVNFIMAYRDIVVFNRETIALFLRFSVTNKIPIVGFIETMTQKGCMISFHPDVEKLGKSSAEFMLNLIDNPALIMDPIKTAGVSYSLNSKFLNLFRYKLSAEIKNNASATYQ